MGMHVRGWLQGATQSQAFRGPATLLFILQNSRGQKTAQEKKQIPGNGGSQELFGPMFPWFCLFSLSFQWEEGQKFPGTLFLGTFFSYFRWFFSFRNRGPITHPKSQNTKKTSRLRELFRKFARTSASSLWCESGTQRKLFRKTCLFRCILLFSVDFFGRVFLSWQNACSNSTLTAPSLALVVKKGTPPEKQGLLTPSAEPSKS